MDPGIVAQHIFNGLMLGVIYATVAVGFSLFFGVLDVVNLSHGDVVTLGAFSGLGAITLAGVGIMPASDRARDRSLRRDALWCRGRRFHRAHPRPPSSESTTGQRAPGDADGRNHGARGGTPRRPQRRQSQTLSGTPARYPRVARLVQHRSWTLSFSWWAAWR